MATPSSRSELADYCKRQLGAPVLEINIADEQVEDIMDDAIQFFQERHFDGVSQSFLKYKISQDDIDRGKANMRVRVVIRPLVSQLKRLQQKLLEYLQLLLSTKIVITCKFLQRLLE